MLTILSRDNLSVKLNDKTNGYEYAYVTQPTYNCQLASFGPIQDLFESRYPKKPIVNLFKELEGLTMIKKNIVLFDIRSDELEEIVKGAEIISQQPYTSTNGSEMVIVLVDYNKTLRKNKK